MVHLLSLLLKLRMICCHEFLIGYRTKFIKYEDFYNEYFKFFMSKQLRYKFSHDNLLHGFFSLYAQCYVMTINNHYIVLRMEKSREALWPYFLSDVFHSFFLWKKLDKLVDSTSTLGVQCESLSFIFYFYGFYWSTPVLFYSKRMIDLYLYRIRRTIACIIMLRMIR